MKKFLTLLAFLVVYNAVNAQIVNYINAEIKRSSGEPQRSPFLWRSDKRIKFSQFLFSIDHPNGYYSIGVTYSSPLLGNVPTLNIYSLDKSLALVKDIDFRLVGENKEDIDPIVIYKNGDKIELICTHSSKSENKIDLVNWEFSLSDFSILTKNKKLVTFPYYNKSEAEYGYDINETTNQLGISFFQETDNKEGVLYSASFDKEMNVIVENSVNVPFDYNRGAVSSIKTGNDGTVWTVLDERDRDKFFGYVTDDISIGTYVASVSKTKSLVTPVTKNGQNIIGASLTTSNSNALVAGLVSSSNPNFVSTLYVGEIDIDGKLLTKVENVFTKQFIGKTSKIDKKAKDVNDALSKNYYVRDILVRENGTIDIVISYVTYKEELQSNGRNNESVGKGSTSRYGDVFVISFSNDKMVSSLCFNRYLMLVYHLPMEPLLLKKYTVPHIFTKNNNLYITLNINSESFENSSNDPELKDEWLDKSINAVYRVDKNFKVAKQALINEDDASKSYTYQENFQKVTSSQILSIYHGRSSMFKAKSKFFLFTFK